MEKIWFFSAPFWVTKKQNYACDSERCRSTNAEHLLILFKQRLIFKLLQMGRMLQVYKIIDLNKRPTISNIWYVPEVFPKNGPNYCFRNTFYFVGDTLENTNDLFVSVLNRAKGITSTLLSVKGNCCCNWRSKLSSNMSRSLRKPFMLRLCSWTSCSLLDSTCYLLRTNIPGTSSNKWNSQKKFFFMENPSHNKIHFSFQI